jgi:hypothetical protein
MFIYREPEENSFPAILKPGIYCADPYKRNLAHRSFTAPAFCGHAHHSSAPLKNIKCARVFVDSQDNCTGILFEYHDGCQRAVGHCALGISAEKCYHRPQWIIYEPGICSLSYNEVVFVWFASEPPTLVEGELLCRKLEGYITLWSGEAPGELRDRRRMILEITD